MKIGEKTAEFPFGVFPVYEKEYIMTTFVAGL
jgi:hypothetical protein